MMLGLKTTFHYRKCAACATLWLADPPQDYSPYYPEGYFSFAGSDDTGGQIRKYLRRKRDRTYFERGGVLGRFLARVYTDPALLSVSWLGIEKDAHVLDVGCGRGSLLRRMKAVGFRHLEGIDPFLSQDVVRENGVRIRRRQLEELEGEKFDVVMFHHSLEHVVDPKRTLELASGLLMNGGRCLVRLPVVAFAWEEYGVNWVQLDPPRHVWVPTENSMRVLVESTGLRVEKVEYDSTGFQFWGSELYVRGVPLVCADSSVLGQQFGRRSLEEFRARAAYLNSEGRGDQGVFVLAV